MKYKRQLMGSMIALAIFMSNSPSFDLEDSVSTSKVPQYVNQVKMKSEVNEGKVDVRNKK